MRYMVQSTIPTSILIFGCFKTQSPNVNSLNHLVVSMGQFQTQELNTGY